MIMSNPEDTEEEFYVSKDGQISVSLVDDKSRLDKLKLLVQARERELRQAAEYGLGLLEANEELQMQVKTLKIQLETETEELVVERDAWKRRTEHAKHEIIQWKRKYARVEEEKTILAEEFEQFVDHCECRRQDIVPATDDVSVSSENEYSHHLDTIAQLQTELQKVQMLDHSKEMELKLLREWKQIAEQQQHETCECEVFAEESENLHKKKLLQELNATQRGINELKIENDALHKAAQQHETDMQLLKKQLRVAEEAKDDTLVHSNRVSEELLSSESRCQRLQRELELLQHISYFSQAIVDRDDEESDEDDECIEVKDILDQVTNMDPEGSTSDAENRAMLSPLRSKQRRSFLDVTATPSLPHTPNTATKDGSRMPVPELEKDTHKKLYHYFHLTALSIIHENSLIERCFNSSSRITIDMWYHEVIAKKVPFLMWHSWLTKRISKVTASVQGEDGVSKRFTLLSKGSGFGSAFHGFSMRKIGGSGNSEAANTLLPSPPTASSSPASPPVARVPFSVARAFFRLLRKSTRASASASATPNSKCSADGSPAQ